MIWTIETLTARIAVLEAMTFPVDSTGRVLRAHGDRGYGKTHRDRELKDLRRRLAALQNPDLIGQTENLFPLAAWTPVTYPPEK
jgi:hypothetical protein